MVQTQVGQLSSRHAPADDAECGRSLLWAEARRVLMSPQSADELQDQEEVPLEPNKDGMEGVLKVSRDQGALELTVVESLLVFLLYRRVHRNTLHDMHT